MRALALLACLAVASGIASAKAEDASTTSPSTQTPPAAPATGSAQPPPAQSRTYPSHDYPSESVRAGEEGTILVHYRVNEHGAVDAAEIATSSGSPRLDQAALATVHRWRFKPAMKGGKPVAVWQYAKVQFRLR